MKSPIVEIAKKVCPAVITVIVSKNLPEAENFYSLPVMGKKGKREKNQRDGGKRFHQARPVKQKDTPTAKSLLTIAPLKTDLPSP